MDLELTGKTAIVTGGSRGIGKQVALLLSREGVDVAIAARDPERLNATAKELSNETGRKVVPLVVDTGDDKSVKKMVAAAVEALGGVDILVNNAAIVGGIATPPKLKNVTQADFWSDMNVKVMGYLRCAQAAAPYMIERNWGRIINVSGMAARQSGSTIGSIRNVSVVALTKNLADELGEHGINVTAVHPGATRTERTAPETEKQMAKNNSVKQVIDAHDIAAIVAFLASPKSVAISGDVIAAGGGVGRSIYY
ncbi:MAG: NAD(P)-dependent dehydrogenase, short-chain alcohol dehydrogenase family [Chloroflexi bacterium]|jgi:NAD(P)-dependent dehydrogenase (short-subunit alcohol dehydrogenase family)|nr:MAG: NAD(P)-dependent dehydrogenase, short-chain alcohol dehydrogenase family [Chloroflexota bacterium]